MVSSAYKCTHLGLKLFAAIISDFQTKTLTGKSLYCISEYHYPLERYAVHSGRGYRRLRGTYHLHLQVQRISQARNQQAEVHGTAFCSGNSIFAVLGRQLLRHKCWAGWTKRWEQASQRNYGSVHHNQTQYLPVATFIWVEAFMATICNEAFSGHHLGYPLLPRLSPSSTQRRDGNRGGHRDVDKAHHPRWRHFMKFNSSSQG
jgi:hypothetical protein